MKRLRRLIERALRISPGGDLLPLLLPDLRDVITFGGLACACYGIAMLSVPAAWIVGGACLFWLGVRRA